MKADEAAEMMDAEKSKDTFKQRAAVAIAFFAMLLAITGLGGQNATKDALNSNVEASNYWNFFQAKNMRQTAYALAADEIEAAWLATPGLPDEARAALKDKAAKYRATVARYESEPTTNEGKTELVARAKQLESKRDHALKQDPYFDYAEALLQIAIVLISVAIVADVVWLSFFGGAVGLLGGLLMINGFTLWVSVPFLS
ncbi:DUF4337 domain-containing protein [Pseudorhodoplanes sp.]|uniref:DUF4337 domain-containing protein n=1 Tax=Pseudorhodoplanes sp. TaxID=1934341 RepID=UPI002C3CB5B1|nr:DUF4337 domain-containing protein [Pseudorhodoplanes sp.]HWV54669.1 DUF4337 domain-containing protein [Pseudorhodoplanes sp.]